MTVAEMMAQDKEAITWLGNPRLCECGGNLEPARIEARNASGTWRGTRFACRCTTCGSEHKMSADELAAAKKALATRQ